MTKTFTRMLAVVTFLLGFTCLAGAQTSPDQVWTAVDDSSFAGRPEDRLVVPSAYKTYSLNRGVVSSILANAPKEFSGESRFTQTILTLPMPDGTFGRFRIEHSLIVEQGLVDKYPELGKTYTGRGIDDPTATVRLDFLPSGFHAMVLSTKGTVMVDPYYAKGDTEHYLTYFKRNAPKRNSFSCDFDQQEAFERLFNPTGGNNRELIPDAASPEVMSGTQLRTYRLALAATVEYTNAVGGGTVAGALAAQVLIMNRVNGVYERDLAIRMVVIANNNLIVWNAEPDPYTNNSGTTMLSQNQTSLDTIIGIANYDIGHVFSTGGGGVATLNGPCGGTRARGVTGLTNPTGDPFAIDYVAHEMGHQWGANHTFNGATSNCSGGNRSAGSAYEPGSGITIMAYAGICGGQNLSDHSIDTFHVKSLEVIVNYSQIGNGNTCAVTTLTGNTPPAVSVVGGPSWNIPKQTPFTLTATGSDANGDTLTYDWEEYDLGASTTAIPNTDADAIRPIFRPFLPVSGPSRTFPALEHILTSANVPPAQDPVEGYLTGELLPAVSRTMTFQVVARDNRANGGGINTATATVAVDGASGPFAITAPNTGVSWGRNSTQTVTWNVANTTAAPVSAANVKILFSTDGGQTFPTVLAASTANDGSESITIPNVLSTTARIRVEAVGNIFFDISDTSFTVVEFAPVKAPFDFDGDNKTDLSVFRPSNGSWWWQRSSDGQVPALVFGSSTDKAVPADYTGDGKADIAFYRPSTGEWYILRSENFSYYSIGFGLAGDVPVPGDFDADNKADLAIFRPSTNTWYIQKSNGGFDILGFGTAGDKPVVGDYDGDSKADIAIFRPAVTGGEWWIRRSGDGSVIAFQFGAATDRPVQGRFTADNKTDVAFWRPSTGTWYILRSEDGSFYAVPFGIPTDIPVPGDYDGDGRFDNAIFRPSTSTWYVDRSTAGILIQQFGLATDTPLPSVYVP